VKSLPESVRRAWEDREGPAILATVGADGAPNVIYVTCVGVFGDDRLVVADNYFDKTRRNLLLRGKGSILFRDKTGKNYQVKGSMEYHVEGEVFDSMKAWNPSEHPGHAAAALRVEEVFSGAEKLS
jgi:predicted pyridoxine 5'-phosphate oxidase superfamily flavin-nucleotide-binding protein